VCRLLLVIREFQIVLCWLLIMDIAGVAALQILDVFHENKAAALRYVEDLTWHPYFRRIQRIVPIESYLVERLVGWAECFVNLVQWSVSDGGDS